MSCSVSEIDLFLASSTCGSSCTSFFSAFVVFLVGLAAAVLGLGAGAGGGGGGFIFSSGFSFSVSLLFVAAAVVVVAFPFLPLFGAAFFTSSGLASSVVAFLPRPTFLAGSTGLLSSIGFISVGAV